MSVIVAVRVRPFNQREKELNSNLCLKMQGQTTVLIDENNNERKFTFDHSFWSHDQFEILPDGYFSPTSDKYADQKYVFETVGQQVLRNALDGYHCCLFAYGQTGSGKSYSMIGYGENKGIVPISFQEIFDIIQKQTNDKKWFEVNISMLEIYNEKIQDLLKPVSKRKKGGLKVRESKSVGVFVEGLSKHAVNSYEAIERKMEEGNTNRTIASTRMNATSSRAHTIISVELTQIEVMLGKKVQKFSQINLVDLAGSEKISKTGATGDRLKEGTSINKSLTVLGKVISALADISTGKNKTLVVPYRESALTRILQNALGGNSKTLMICAISPSDNNYDETLSTLRYADRAKRIKCFAVINESETDKKIRMLQNENEQLKNLIKELQRGNQNALTQYEDILDIDEIQKDAEKDAQTQQNQDNDYSQQFSEQDSQISEDSAEKEKQQKILQDQIIELQEKLKAHNQLINEYEKTFEQKLKEEEQKPKQQQIVQDLEIPHIYNLNEDPLLSGKIYHNFKNKDNIQIGKNKKNDIILMGLGIQDFHAIVFKKNDKFIIEPQNQEAKNFIFLNGEKVTEKQELQDWDRLMFSLTTIFIFRNPLKYQFPEKFQNENQINWENCQEEMLEKQANFKAILNQEEIIGNQNKFKEIEENYENLKNEHQQQLIQIQQEHEKKLKNLEQEFQNISVQGMTKEELIAQEQEKYEFFKNEIENQFQHQIEVENQKKQVNDNFLNEYRLKENLKIKQKQSIIEPNIMELNLIAKELKRKIEFSFYLDYFYVDLENINSYEKHKKKYRIRILVDNKELGYHYYWNLQKFSYRYDLIKQLYNDYFENGVFPDLTQEEDPFWDPREPERIGETFFKLFSLAYLIDSRQNLTIVGNHGVLGTLDVYIYPCSKNWVLLTEEDSIFENFIDDPYDLVGKNLKFIVQIGFFKKRDFYRRVNARKCVCKIYDQSQEKQLIRRQNFLHSQNRKIRRGSRELHIYREVRV